ncbi:MAG: hypothetical protein VX015_00815 [Planctomycetota bacterium]|nr:hypothetical protein [Planctomycetota bacterium]
MSAWRPHILLLAIAGAVIVRAAATHVSTEEAMRVAFDDEADARARIESAHVAACRATARSARLGEDLARAFLEAEDELLREAAVTIDLCRHALERSGDRDERTPPLQEAYVYSPLGPDGMTPHRLRALVLHRRKVGGKAVGGIGRISSTEADWFLRTLRGAALPPTQQMTAYFQSRNIPSRLVRPRGR